MGLLTELFVGHDGDAKKFDAARGSGARSVKLGGLTNLEFETLWAILSAEEWNPETHALEEVASTDSTWTFKFPRAYIDRLRALDAPGISSAAKSWAATEELSCKPAEIEPVIHQLVSLARSVEDGRLDMFVWTSL
jgi:hypothetical protein